MRFSDEERRRLEGVVTRARDDAAYRKALCADPRSVLRADADFELPADARVETLFASAAQFTMVLPSARPEGDEPPLVVHFETGVPVESMLSQLGYLEPSVPALVQRATRDPEFRRLVVEDLAAAFRQISQGTTLLHTFQVVDPDRADWTLVFPQEDEGEEAGAVAILPRFADDGTWLPSGLDVATLESSSGGELSDEQLEAVAGGKSSPDGKSGSGGGKS